MGANLNNLRKSGRYNFRSNKRYNSRSNNSHSYNKNRPKGNNAPLLHEKYIKLAKEASSSGDKVQAEYYNQFADHYSRIIKESSVRNSFDEDLNKNLNTDNENNSIDNEKIIKVSKEESLKDSNKINKKNLKKDEEDQEEIIEDDNDSLETVSFISEPIKKTSKTKKQS